MKLVDHLVHPGSAAASLLAHHAAPARREQGEADDPEGSIPASLCTLQWPTGNPVRDWICYDEFHWVPVVDRASGDLHGAWSAVEVRDLHRAQIRMRSLASTLRDQAMAASTEDPTSCSSDQKRARNDSWRLASCALRAGLSATGLASGDLRTTADLRKVFDQRAVQDLDRRWLFVRQDIWYSVCGEVQRHFSAASREIALRNSDRARIEIRKALGFLRLEEARAGGLARIAINRCLARLHRLAIPAGPAPAVDRSDVDEEFSSSLLAICLAHRNRASDAWLRGHFHVAGYEFMAAGENLRHSLGWIGHQVNLASYAVALDCSALGRRIIVNGVPSRSDVLDVIRSIGMAVDALQREFGFWKPGSANPVPPGVLSGRTDRRRRESSVREMVR